jgi:hypothetical protein
MITAVFRNSEFATTLCQVHRCIPIYLAAIPIPPVTHILFYIPYLLFLVYTTIVTFPSAVHTPPQRQYPLCCGTCCVRRQQPYSYRLQLRHAVPKLTPHRDADCSCGHFLAVALAAKQNRPLILLALQSQAHNSTLHLLRNKYEQCSRVVAWWPYRCCSVRSVRSGRASPGETEIDMEWAGQFTAPARAKII